MTKVSLGGDSGRKLSARAQRSSFQPLTGPPATITKPLLPSRYVSATALFLALNLLAAALPEAPQQSLAEALSGDLHAASLTGKPESWWMAKQYLASARSSTPPVVLLGSSQMQCFYTTDAKVKGQDIDELLNHDCQTLSEQIQARSGRRLECFNASLAGSMLSDRYWLARALFTPEHTPNFAVIGIAPRDFIDNTLPCISATEPFQFFAPFLNIDRLEESAFADPLARLNWQLTPRLPLRRLSRYSTTQSLARSFLPASRTDNKIVVDKEPFFFGTDTTFNVKPGKCLIPHLAFEGFINNNHEYKERYKQWRTPSYREQMRYLNLLLDDLAAKKIETVLVGMPLEPMNSAILGEDFWHDYESNVTAAAKQHGLAFHDLSHSEQFHHEDFADGVHLNWRGGKKLASMLAQAIVGQANHGASKRD